MSNEDIYTLNAASILLSILAYFILAIFTMVLYHYIDNKNHINIYKKKNKIYETKIDPIYKIVNNYSSFYDHLYRIEKWELSWVEYKKIKWLTNILLYPINIYEWKYKTTVDIIIGDEDKLRLMHDELLNTNSTIGERYESIIENINNKAKIEKQKEDELKSILSTCNKEFDENYE